MKDAPDHSGNFHEVRLMDVEQNGLAPGAPTGVNNACSFLWTGVKGNPPRWRTDFDLSDENNKLDWITIQFTLDSKLHQSGKACSELMSCDRWLRSKKIPLSNL